MTQVNLAIKATNLELTDAIRSLVEEKFRALAKFVTPHPDRELNLAAEVGRKNKAKSKADDLFFAELNVVVGGERHRAVATAPDIRDAVDGVKREMVAHLSKLHGKAKENFAKGARAIKEALHTDPGVGDTMEELAEIEAEAIALPLAALAAKPPRRIVVAASAASPKPATAARPKAKKRKVAARRAKPKAKPAAKAKSRKHAGRKGTKNTRGAKNRPPRKVAPARKGKRR